MTLVGEAHWLPQVTESLSVSVSPKAELIKRSLNALLRRGRHSWSPRVRNC